jgi:hypothetical protein
MSSARRVRRQWDPSGADNSRDSVLIQLEQGAAVEHLVNELAVLSLGAIAPVNSVGARKLCYLGDQSLRLLRRVVILDVVIRFLRKKRHYTVASPRVDRGPARLCGARGSMMRIAARRLVPCHYVFANGRRMRWLEPGPRRAAAGVSSRARSCMPPYRNPQSSRDLVRTERSVETRLSSSTVLRVWAARLDRSHERPRIVEARCATGSQE